MAHSADVPDPAWLAAVLRGSGVLEQGEIVSLETIPVDAFNSRTVRLRPRYSTDASPAAPVQLLWKRSTTEAWSMAAGEDEARFYQQVMALGDHPPVVPPCFAAGCDPSSGEPYILLQDLSATHMSPITREQQLGIVEGVPPVAAQEAVIDTLARLHAYWWDHPLLKDGIFEVGYWSRNAERFARYLEKRRDSWIRLMRKEQSWFPAGLRSFYEQFFARLPRYWESFLAPRFRSGKNLTLTHGDAYFCNFLVPIPPGAGPAYLLDWQSPSGDLAAYDLVNLLAAFWTREQRSAENRERRLLQRYLDALQSLGIRQYTWNDLTADYQAGLIFWVLMPVQDGADGAGKDYWWPKMQCLLAAFEDWQCASCLDLPNLP